MSHRVFPIIVTIVTAFCRAETTRTDLVFDCRPDNDLYQALTASGISCPRYETAEAAIERASPGATVLILADGYPEATTRLDPVLFDKAAARNIQLYVEYPAAIPGLSVDAPRKTQWERVVVSSDAFGPALPRLRILMVQGCHFTPMAGADPWLIAGRVAGFDTAVFGLPKEQFPILLQVPGRRLTVAATKLSGFVRGRYAPTKDWQVFWEQMLGKLANKAPLTLTITPIVRPAYGPTEPLGTDAEKHSLAALTRWVLDARLLVHPSVEPEIHKLLAGNGEMRPTPGPQTPGGDGSHGLLEGFDSAIGHDGSQQQRIPLRTDCHGEMAACMALDWVVNKNASSRRIAENLLDFVFFTSEAMRGVRGDPAHPAFGHVAWGIVAPVWRIANYGDDDARVIQGAIVTAACLQSDRWDEPIMRSLLANLRTTGKLGFRGSRVDIGPLEKFGWKHFHDADTVFLSPHYESALWACDLWAFSRCGYQPFLDQARSAIRITMQAYPDRWLWRNNLERARMIVGLAWLVRVDDTPEHRGWLTRVVDDLLAYQDPCGAIREILGTKGSGHFLAPTSNEEYGTREMPIIQDTGDAASDQLYVSGFALIGLHEAAAVLDDPKLKGAEDKLAAYLCRIQVRSDQVPYVNGGWFRAFDFKRWEYWASSGDAGWGAWSMEAGWGQAWGAVAMGLRAMNTTIWDLTAHNKIGLHLAAVQQLMAVNKGGPWKPTTQPGGS